MSTLEAQNEAIAEQTYELYDHLLHYLRSSDADPRAAVGACAKLVVAMCEWADKPHDAYGHAQTLIAQLWKIAQTHGRAGTNEVKP